MRIRSIYGVYRYDVLLVNLSGLKIHSGKSLNTTCHLLNSCKELILTFSIQSCNVNEHATLTTCVKNNLVNRSENFSWCI